jgi:hypothetical protein
MHNILSGYQLHIIHCRFGGIKSLVWSGLIVGQWVKGLATKKKKKLIVASFDIWWSSMQMEGLGSLWGRAATEMGPVGGGKWGTRKEHGKVIIYNDALPIIIQLLGA